jgi:hypothetical protein
MQTNDVNQFPHRALLAHLVQKPSADPHSRSGYGCAVTRLMTGTNHAVGFPQTDAVSSNLPTTGRGNRYDAAMAPDAPLRIPRWP